MAAAGGISAFRHKHITAPMMCDQTPFSLVNHCSSHLTLHLTNLTSSQIQICYSSTFPRLCYFNCPQSSHNATTTTATLTPAPATAPAPPPPKAPSAKSAAPSGTDVSTTACVSTLMKAATGARHAHSPTGTPAAVWTYARVVYVPFHSCVEIC
jgi:hypothetical protein